VNDVTPTAVRLAPPLVITPEQADEGAELLRSAIQEVSP
jgi:4-aminobutyrate aminotransferase-like enzyme